MKHLLYKVTHPNGKYYIGRHSTNNVDDNYIGSGKWVRSLKNKNVLVKEILAEFSTLEDLYLAEEAEINNNIDNPNCMNFNNRSCGFATGKLNPAKNEMVRLLISRHNWMKTSTGRKHASENNPSKLEHVKEMRRVSALSNPKFVEQWYLGEKHHSKSNQHRTKMSVDNPMFNEVTRNKISNIVKQQVKDGNWALNKPEVREKQRQSTIKRLLTNNPMKNPESLAKMIASRTKNKVICPFCSKEGVSGYMMQKYHFNNCKLKIK